MPSYATLDQIADAYIPLLLGCVLSLLIYDWHHTNKSGRFKHTVRLCGPLVLATIVVYATMALDQALRLWPYFNGDYSTHTAAGTALCYLLWQRNRLLWRLLGTVSLGMYCLLMRYQQYHSWGDMLSTLFCVLILLVLVQYGFRKWVAPSAVA